MEGSWISSELTFSGSLYLTNHTQDADSVAIGLYLNFYAPFLAISPWFLSTTEMKGAQNVGYCLFLFFFGAGVEMLVNYANMGQESGLRGCNGKWRPVAKIRLFCLVLFPCLNYLSFFYTTFWIKICWILGSFSFNIFFRWVYWKFLTGPHWSDRCLVWPPRIIQSCIPSGRLFYLYDSITSK